jgi:hypothetical protein
VKIMWPRWKNGTTVVWRVSEWPLRWENHIHEVIFQACLWETTTYIAKWAPLPCSFFLYILQQEGVISWLWP